MWVVRAAAWNLWHVIGVFDDHDLALDAAQGKPHLIDALPLNEAFPIEALGYLAGADREEQ